MSVEERLGSILDGMGRVVVAVSGGVDSLTLLAFAARRRPSLGGADGSSTSVTAVHAVSEAVPAAATMRVRQLATREGVALAEIDAGETRDDRYLANPVDRCFHCKSHLYDAIADHLAELTAERVPFGVAPGRTVVSGTNADDLHDYRPGLAAAAARGVRHPFVEAGVDKAGVRALARTLGLGSIAELPAQPCLASRVETGVRIEPRTLPAIGDVEEAVRARLGEGVTVRCRVRAAGVVVEIEEALLAQLDGGERATIVALAGRRFGRDVRLAPYRRGSAFLRVLPDRATIEDATPADDQGRS
jgi:uncharacterized protein